MSIEVNFDLKSVFQENIFNSTIRHICGSGGYGNGKTTAACMRGITFLSKFPKYRIVIGRQKANDLARTTRTTFFSHCPPELYDEKKGGKRADSLNYTRFINGSEVFWMHFDDFDEGTVKGLELNSVILDQAEEISENIFLHLDARVNRWTQAEVPADLLKLRPNWPLHPATRRPRVPGWMIVLSNPGENLYHWIYNRFHKDSLEHKLKYKDRYVMYEAQTDKNLLDPDTIKEAESRDPAWLERFFFGRWGFGQGTIHNVTQTSRISPPREFIQTLLRKAALYRILDHGESSPTCCLWIAAYKGQHFIYREYYQGDTLISEHRKNIAELSEKEQYIGNYADPSIFNKTRGNATMRWTTADEYLDTQLCNWPTIFWQPADNNEFSTRNRINEMLRIHSDVIHPITGELGAPKLYFIEKSDRYPFGCFHSIRQTESQKRKQIGTDNGRPVFEDDRDDSVEDHAYDPLRYYVALHSQGSTDPRPKIPEGSFLAARKQIVAQNRMKALTDFGYFNARN